MNIEKLVEEGARELNPTVFDPPKGMPDIFDTQREIARAQARAVLALALTAQAQFHEQREGVHCGESTSEIIHRLRLNAWHKAEANRLRSLATQLGGKTDA